MSVGEKCNDDEVIGWEYSGDKPMYGVGEICGWWPTVENPKGFGEEGNPDWKPAYVVLNNEFGLPSVISFKSLEDPSFSDEENIIRVNATMSW